MAVADQQEEEEREVVDLEEVQVVEEPSDYIDPGEATTKMEMEMNLEMKMIVHDNEPSPVISSVNYPESLPQSVE